MDKIAPKLLRKVSNGRIFPYTETLAKRKDMVPVWPDDVNPNISTPRTGLEIEASKDLQFSGALAEKDAIILNLNRQIEDLNKVISEQNEHITRLNQMISTAPNAPETTQEVPPADPGRMAKITEAAKKIMEVNDPNNFTGSGKIRIEPLEAACGLADITAGERDAAMESLK